MGREGIRKGWAVAVGMAAIWSGGASTAEAAPLPQSQTYYGDPEDCQRPGEVEASRVFNEISEWQEIQKRSLNPDQAEYWILLDKANQKFYKAIHKAAQKLRLDLVAELGTLPRDKGEPPNVTDQTIGALEK